MFDSNIPKIDEPNFDLMSFMGTVIDGVTAFNKSNSDMIKEVSIIYNNDKENKIVNFQYTYRRYPAGSLPQTVAVQ